MENDHNDHHTMVLQGIIRNQERQMQEQERRMQQQERQMQEIMARLSHGNPVSKSVDRFFLCVHDSD